VYARFEVPAQPALAVVERNGEVSTLFGAVDEETLDEVLSETTG
jgi:hypothetical protein